MQQVCLHSVWWKGEWFAFFHVVAGIIIPQSEVEPVSVIFDILFFSPNDDP